VEGLSIAIKEQVREKNLEGILMARGTNITHLMFVDDIILFGNGSFNEWILYKDLLERFIKATGMAFSPHKSMFLEDGWTTEELVVLKVFLPYHVTSVDLGFKYLRCFLKPNYYKKTDWFWLVRNFEKRIAIWSLRWLSLGGRVRLSKVVLESIHVY